MKSKRQTPLGYLMDLLDVSLQDLGDYLYVAQTSISKWKTGARTLRPESQHFAGIVEYFGMLARDAERGEKLARLFQRLYPEQRQETEQDLAMCLRAFLGGKLLPPMALQLSLDERGKLYTAQFSVYNGEDGLTNALMQLAAFLAAQQETVMVSILDARAATLRALLPALTQGHFIRIFADGAQALPYAGEAAPVLSHANCEVRLLPQGTAFPPQALYCAVENRLLLLSSVFPEKPRYTALYTDELTIAQYHAGFDGLWARTGGPFTDMDADAISADRLRALNRTTLDERTDWLLPALPHMTMGRNLLMEVLEANGVPGRTWQRVLHCYDEIAATRMRLLVPAEALAAPQRTVPELSLLTGTEMRLTDAQARRHMLDTAALLRAGDRVALLPLQMETPEAWRQAALMTKRNALAGFLDFASGRLRYTRHPQVVEGFMREMDGRAAQLTGELRTPEYVAGLLERAALRFG